jgi:predicted nucleotidyltransferase
MVITEQMRENIAEIARRYGIALFVLFGSQATGQTHKKSDADIAYSSLQPLLLQRENRMAVELHEIFRMSRVDIVNLSAAGPLLLKQVTEAGIPLFEAKPSLFNELYLYAKKVYREARPLFELRRRYVLRKAQQYKKELSHA